MKEFLRWVFLLPRQLVLLLIWFYQRTISPDHGIFKNRFPHGYCRFYPTCSEYGYQVIKKRGLVIGLVKTGWRIMRCNPFNKGGVDLP